MADICWNFVNRSLELEGTSYTGLTNRLLITYPITGRAMCVNINRSMKMSLNTLVAKRINIRGFV